MENKIHVFEQSGLGIAPFYFIGASELHYGNPSAGQDFGGSCEYCGHYIKTGCVIKSSDGKTFIVGTDCVLKTGDKGLKEKVDEAIKKQKRDKHAQDWKWAQEVYVNYSDKLSEMKHPYLSDKSMYEYIVYCLNHGHFESTEKRIISAVKKAAKSI